MKLLILQHIKYETPGYIKDLMIKDGHDLITIELDEGESIPKDINQFDTFRIDIRSKVLKNYLKKV